MPPPPQSHSQAPQLLQIQALFSRSMMKFADFLMGSCRPPSQRRLQLEEEVLQLQHLLDNEQRINKILRCALQRPPVPRTCFFSVLPVQVQILLVELEMVEEEIIFLGKKVEEMQFMLYQEKKQVREWRRQQKQHYMLEEQCQELSCHKWFEDFKDHIHIPKDIFPCQRIVDERTSPTDSNIETCKNVGTQSCIEQEHSLDHLDLRNKLDSPNKLSQELIACLISVFHKLYHSTTRVDSQLSPIASKLGISCMSSKNCEFRSSSKSRVNGPYKKFIQFMQDSLDASRISQCHPDIRILMVILNRLSTMNISFLTYKQRLAFWINIYNACIMQAFLLHGVPPNQDKLLMLLNKAAINVGGIILNALAIEHFILRHRTNQRNEDVNDKEALLRHNFGLGYPEPNITFALCRGSWSSPALRVYTEDNIVDELERAKVEYLEASIQITSKKKIFVPKLLHCHMRDFADDMESLLEWIYSQLPRTGSLKRLIMECLTIDGKLGRKVSMEVQPYVSKFRYLLPT